MRVRDVCTPREEEVSEKCACDTGCGHTHSLQATIVTSPSLSPNHNGIDAIKVFLVVALKYFVPMSAVFVLILITFDVYCVQRRNRRGFTFKLKLYAKNAAQC